jgi:hypothetical protein
MEAELLKEFSIGDQVTTGCLMPGLDDEEIVWTVNTAVHNGKRVISPSKNEPGRTEEFSLVRFDLTYFGIQVGEIEAAGQSDGKVNWRSLK